jgi:hypothetical protein
VLRLNLNPQYLFGLVALYRVTLQGQVVLEVALHILIWPLRDLHGYDAVYGLHPIGPVLKWLTSFLYWQQSKDAELSARLTLLELPNLMALLLWMQQQAMPEDRVEVAHNMETLFARLGRPQALTEATRVREQGASGLSQWSYARYLSETANIEQLLTVGDLLSAHTAAQDLLRRCLAAGEEAYPGADYDIAMSHFRLGRVLSIEG